MKEPKIIVDKDDILCARCKFRYSCRFGGAPVSKDDKCGEFRRDWNVKLSNSRK